jgi:hypothetical protein
MLHAGNRLDRAATIFEAQKRRRPASRLAIRQPARVLRRRVSRWQNLRPLPRPLLIPGVPIVRTFPDVRELIERHLPKAY